MSTDWDDELQRELDKINSAPRFFHGIRLWWNGRKTEYTVKRIEQAQQFKNAVHAFEIAEQMHQNLKDKLEIENRLDKKNFELTIEVAVAQIAVQRCQTQLLEAASSVGMTVEDYSDLNKQRALIDVEVEKHRQLKQVDLDYEASQMEMQLKAAFAYQLGSLDHAARVLQMIHQYKRKRYEMYFTGDPLPLIEQQVRDYDRHILALEGIHERLLQGDNGKDVQRGDSHTVSGGDSRKGLAAGEEQIPTPPDRPK